MFALSQTRLLNVIAASALAASPSSTRRRRRWSRRQDAASRSARADPRLCRGETRGGVLRDGIRALHSQCQRVGQYRGASGLGLRIRVSLSPGQLLRIDSLEAETKSLDLECGDDAKTLPIADAS